MAMLMADDRICVGILTGAFGVQGEVRLKSFCAEPAAIADYAPLALEDGRTFDLVLTRPIKSGFAARMTLVTTPEQAEALRGARVFAARQNLPSLPDDEFYHADLIGLDVVDTGGRPLGRVTNVFSNGPDDILEVALPGRADTALLPFTHAAVPTVDLAAGRLVADPPEGIFPD